MKPCTLYAAKDACGSWEDGVPYILKIEIESSGQGDFERKSRRGIPDRRLESASPFRECERD